MKAWVLGDPGELLLKDKPVPVPKKAEVLVRIDAVAMRDRSRDHLSRAPASILGGMPHNKNFTPDTNIWARWSRSDPASTNTGSGNA